MSRLATFRIAIWVVVALVGGAALGFTILRNEPAATQEGAYGTPFQLTDKNGGPITEAVFKGKPSAVFFGFTNCPEVCPTTLSELGAYREELKKKNEDFQIVFVTVDPERDTPEILGQYVSNVSNRITGISGPPDKVLEMVKGFRVYAKKVPLDETKPAGDYTMDHTASVFLLDAQGRFRGTIAYGENAETAVQKLENLTKG